MEFLTATVTPSQSTLADYLLQDCKSQTMLPDTAQSCDNDIYPHEVFRGAKHLFSNFFPILTGIFYLGKTWPTVEHAYQAAKASFLDKPWLISLIQRTKDPIQVKRRVSYELYDCDPELVKE